MGAPFRFRPRVSAPGYIMEGVGLQKEGCSMAPYPRWGKKPSTTTSCVRTWARCRLRAEAEAEAGAEAEVSCIGVKCTITP